jgi:tRNA(Arg) A34 adenosine deaminase TadA
MLSQKLKKIFDFTYDKCITNDKFRDEHTKSMHCATLFSGNKILSCECNNHRTNTFGMTIMSEHAECCAIRNYVNKRAKHFPHILSGKKYNSYNKKTQMKNVSLLVIRVNKTGELRNSKCCSICLQIMKSFNIKNVYYSDDKGNFIKEKVKYMYSDFLTTGVKNEEVTDKIILIIISNINKYNIK